MINLELFSCAGGMSEGFRRAGITFDMAFDMAPDHCDSYAANLGHRPVCMDVRDLLRMVTSGAFHAEVDLLVADPPCTPWSRAGKRMGTADERDMLEVTCDLIAALRPRRYLIGNVPGLDDGNNLPTVQRVIGGLSAHGYCTADFVRLDAANYGVPQHRIRPFWFGHLEGPCVRWTAPTHCDPGDLHTHGLPGIAELRPWVTCRDALSHLDPEQLGRPVRMRARVNGTRHEIPVHTSASNAPARAITTQCRAAGHASTITLNERHAPAELGAPAPTMGAKVRGQGAQILRFQPPTSKHPAATPDTPSPTIRAGGGGHTGPHVMLAAESGRKKRPRARPEGPQSSRTMAPDAPATTVQAREDRVGSGSPVLEWPWNRPSTTIQRDERIAPPGHHEEAFSIMSLPDAVILSEAAAAVLQGFPESWVFSGKTKKIRWAQLGQAMPPALAEAVARAIVEQDLATGKIGGG